MTGHTHRRAVRLLCGQKACVPECQLLKARGSNSGEAAGGVGLFQPAGNTRADVCTHIRDQSSLPTLPLELISHWVGVCVCVGGGGPCMLFETIWNMARKGISLHVPGEIHPQPQVDRQIGKLIELSSFY